jgi:hypothetical protein
MLSQSRQSHDEKPERMEGESGVWGPCYALLDDEGKVERAAKVLNVQLSSPPPPSVVIARKNARVCCSSNLAEIGEFRVVYFM